MLTFSEKINRKKMKSFFMSVIVFVKGFLFVIAFGDEEKIKIKSHTLNSNPDSLFLYLILFRILDLVLRILKFQTYKKPPNLGGFLFNVTF